VRFKGEFISKDGSRFSPYLRLSYVNVLSGDDVTIDETRYGTKRWFTEELDDDYFVADLGMTLYSADNFNVPLSYNGRFGDAPTLTAVGSGLSGSSDLLAQASKQAHGR
jgi:hypothetical protein